MSVVMWRHGNTVPQGAGGDRLQLLLERKIKRTGITFGYTVCYALLSISQVELRRMVGLLMNTELESMWKETVVA